MNLLGTFLILFSTFYLFGTIYAADDIMEVAKKVGNKLSEFVEDATKFKYLNSAPTPPKSITVRKGKTIAQQTMEDLTKLFNERLSTLKEVAEYAEKQYKNYSTNLKLDTNYEYFDASSGDSNIQTFREKSFLDRNVSLSTSVVQTPTDLYQYAVKVLNSIEWTKKLDKKFVEIFNKTKTKYKAWQYIGLANGVYRSYPGFLWSNKKEYYDCRQRSWYIEGSSSPKDMVIILDMSGSVIGNRLLIVKLAVITLLDTLQDNDFVNIVYFNSESHYLKQSWTMLVQATLRNRKILKNAIQSKALTGTRTANVAAGFNLAFKILQDSRQNSTSTTSNCTQTIAFFTDGIEGDKVAEGVFNQYNSKKKVRVFTYLVGREKGTPFKAAKWIACENKGYFYRMETLSDVRANIVKYTNVLSRSVTRRPKWTHLYEDALGLGMMTALVAPIFDMKDTSGKRGNQLGVVGMDMRLDEILSKTSEYELGVNGYTFIISNNGIVFSHPEAGVELDVLLSEVERHFPNDDELTKAMIDRKKGEKKTQGYILAKYNGKFRIVKRALTYFYDSITNTSFSVAIALTDYGLRRISLEDDVFKYASNRNQLTSENYNISAAKWPYCEPDDTVEDWQQLRKLIEEKDKAGLKICSNKELIKQLLYDLDKMKDWKPKMGQNTSAVFFGTTSGLTFFTAKNNDSFSETPTKQEYFGRAADYWKNQTIVLSFHNKEIRASRVVTIEDTSGTKDKAIWGVTGVQIIPEGLENIFEEPEDSVYYYLVDENGYIIVSKPNNKRTGQFFGENEGLVMKDLLNKGIFFKYNFTDVQGICITESGSDSSSVRILDPLFALINYAKWWTTTVALSFMQYSFYSIMTGINQVKADGDESEGTTSCFKNMDLYIRQNFNGVISNESLNGLHGCEQSYKSYLVQGTNLMLIIVNGNCSNNYERVTDAAKEICGGTCELLNNYRREPEESGGCVPHSEESRMCSSGKLLLPSVLVLVLVLVQMAIFLKSG